MMADTVGSLFNLPTAQQASQQYYEGLMSTPAQMNQLGLLQQVVAMGRDGGASLGYGAGRLLGGKTADELRIQGVNEAMAEASRLGGTDSEMYAALARGLSARGLTQDALAATEKARAAQRDEQTMSLAASQEARAVSGEKRAMSAEERATEDARQKQLKFEQEMKLYPDALKKSSLELQKAEQDLRGDSGNIQYLQEIIANPATSEADRKLAGAKIADITIKMNKAQAEFTMKQEHQAAQLAHWKAIEAQGAASNQLAREKALQENFSQPASIQVPAEFPGAPPTKLYVGAINPKTGKVRGKDGNIYDSINQAAKEQNIGVVPSIPMAPAPTPTAPQPGFFDRLFSTPSATPPKTPQKPLSAY
jgi:hypothetical protein